MNNVTIEFNRWPDKALFPNKAGNTLHWAQRSALRKAHREEAYFKAYLQPIKIYSDLPYKKATILIRVTAKDKRKRDLDGFLTACKPWIDGIVDAGIIEDDNYFCVPEITIIFNNQIKEDTVTITVSEEA